MPDLDTQLHLDMLRDYKRQNSFLHRVRKAVREVVSPTDYYGREWGDPDTTAPQIFVRDRYVLPYVNPNQVAVEIGPGGGRWTKYLLGFRKLYVIDYHSELLNEVKSRFNQPHVQFIANNGNDFPGVPKQSVDYIFSFACFVHLEPHIISAYLKNMAELLKPGGNGVISYSDTNKVGSRNNPSFSDNNPEKMRGMVNDAGFKVVEEDLTSLWNSSVVRFTR